MCWRDDVVMTRYCSFRGQEYYGDLGHRNCPSRRSKAKEPDPPPKVADDESP